jgi:NAD(P)-dependent dehydrogenase (short-subunit alcohol dehydrogenase family)
MNRIDLGGRVAVVTGGAQGFGRAIAERFITSGAKVAIWDMDRPLVEQTAKEIGADAKSYKVDVSDIAAVEKARDATLEGLGKIDILVNNAGIAGVNRTVWETEHETRRVGANDRKNALRCLRDAVVPDFCCGFEEHVREEPTLIARQRL